MEKQGSLLWAVKMTGRTPLTDGPGHPVNVGVVSTKSGVTQNEGLTRGVQDVELDLLMMVARQKHGNQGCLGRDSTQDMSVKGLSGNWIGQKNLLEPQLVNQPLVNDAGIHEGAAYQLGSPVSPQLLRLLLDR